ncbi:MAG: L-threonylcarbamoyladenylate synthase [Saprospiraceae bacterium]
MNSKLGTDIDYAVELLSKGLLVGIPTETVYGLAANAWNVAAVLNIFKAKNRPAFNPLILHADSIEKFESFGLTFPPKALLLARRFSPGPITYVIPKSACIPDIITSGTDAVAVRVPNHPLTLELLSQLDFPLAAPSANPSGFVSPTSAQHVLDQLSDQVEYVLDGGDCTIGLESTIISFLEDEPEILRFGGLPLEAIEQVIGKVRIPTKGFSDNPVAPGMLERHYATKHKLIKGEIEENIRKFKGSKVALITFNQKFMGFSTEYQFVLSESGNIEEAASQLFSAMRKADSLDVDYILAADFPDFGLGKAINDRLKRASV